MHSPARAAEDVTVLWVSAAARVCVSSTRILSAPTSRLMNAGASTGAVKRLVLVLKPLVPLTACVASRDRGFSQALTGILAALAA